MISPYGPDGRVIAAFHSKEDKDAWLDALEEKLFDLNHPVRKSQ